MRRGKMKLHPLLIYTLTALATCGLGPSQGFLMDSEQNYIAPSGSADKSVSQQVEKQAQISSVPSLTTLHYRHASKSTTSTCPTTEILQVFNKVSLEGARLGEISQSESIELVSHRDLETVDAKLLPDESVLPEETSSKPPTETETPVEKPDPIPAAEDKPDVKPEPSVPDPESTQSTTSPPQPPPTPSDLEVAKVEPLQQNVTDTAAPPSDEKPEPPKEPEPNATEPEIPSFSEWAKKELEEQKKRDEEKRKKAESERLKKQQEHQLKLKQAAASGEAGVVEGGSESAAGSGASASTGGPLSKGDPKSAAAGIDSAASPQAGLKKNFASHDCGSKVILANPEARGSGNVIAPSKDEYMLNKCEDSRWFVVELCENIRAHKVELANYELFSSNFHEVRISLASSYPAKEWDLFGLFEAEDERGVQTFANERGVYGKYARVEVLSHHGSEHYCPVSMFKIYGVSELEIMAQDGEDDPADEVPILTPSAVTQVDPVQSAESSTEVFNATEQADYESGAATTLAFNPECPGCDDASRRDVNFFLAADFTDLESTLASSPALHTALSLQVCHNHGFKAFEAPLGGITPSRGVLLVAFFRTLFGTSRLLALCNVIGLQRGNIPVTLTKPPPTSLPSANPNLQGDSPSTDNSGVEATSEQPDQSSASIQASTPSLNPNVQASDLPQATEPGSEQPEQSGTAGQPAAPASASSPGENIEQQQQPEIPSNPTIVNTPTPVATTNNQRDSVWNKWNMRLKALERNVTLSSGYLEELSVRYKKQIDELQLSVRQSLESVGAANKARQQDRAEMVALNQQMADLASTVEKMSGKIQSVSLITYLHLTFIVVELTVGILMLVCCVWRSKTGHPAAAAVASGDSQVVASKPDLHHQKTTLVARSTSPLRRTASFGEADQPRPLAAASTSGGGSSVQVISSQEETQPEAEDVSQPRRKSVVITPSSNFQSLTSSSGSGIFSTDYTKSEPPPQLQTQMSAPAADSSGAAAASTAVSTAGSGMSKKARRRENRRKTIALLGAGQASRKSNPNSPHPVHPGATSSATFPRYYDTLHTSSPARATLYEGLEADHSTTDWQRVTRANSVENARVPGGTFSHSRVAGQLSPRVPGSQHQQVSLAGPRTFGGTANTVVNDQIMDTSSRFLVQPVVNVFVSNDPVVTSNKYGCLNSSVHGNETPGRIHHHHHQSQLTQAGPAPPTPGSGPYTAYITSSSAATNATTSEVPNQHFRPRRRLFEGDNPEVEPFPLATPTAPSSARKIKRSKSTSPTRPATNQRDLYRNINPDTQAWKG